MKVLSIYEVNKAINGEIIRKELIQKQYIKSISIDTRKMERDSLYIPIIGERFDGHDFIESAYEQGASLVLTSNKNKLSKDYGGIYVKDTKEALILLARYYRNLFKIPVIGITGSVGKTSCKEMIASVLSTGYQLHKTKGNYNNEIGLPLTILSMNPSTEVAVYEMGMNHYREIDLLSSIAKPNFAIITNIGVSHIENFGSKDGILKAKSEIVNHLDKDGYLILNGDDLYLKRLESKVKQKIIYFGFENNNDYYITEYKELGFKGIKATVKSPNNIYNIRINALGKHLLYHVLSAIVIGEKLDLSKKQIEKGIYNYKSEKMRLNKITINNNITIINDSYNASVESMKAALDVLNNINTNGRKVAILGDMLEMGDYTSKAHSEVGTYAVDTDIDLLICVGENAKWIYNQVCLLRGNQNLLYYPEQKELIKEINYLIKSNDIILVKASRGMKLEDTIEKIKEVG
ncbi:MAG: UDP-N-acetylmuramoyl-tripeptide--D-alanyl-D-alanine ligase [Eubacteriales bacterium]